MPTLKDVREAESIGIPGVARRGTLGEKDMPRLPGQVELAGVEGVQDGANGQVSAEREQVPMSTQEEEAEHDRRDSSISVPDLVHSRTGENSSTSLDTLGDGDSPLSPDGTGQLGAEGQGDQVVIVGGAGEGEEQDPKVLALHRYKEGLYTYTRGLWLEAKSSSARTDKDKRRASTSPGSGSAFGQKQSGMERLAAKKALARRLNA